MCETAPVVPAEEHDLSSLGACVERSVYVFLVCRIMQFGRREIGSRTSELGNSYRYYECRGPKLVIIAPMGRAYFQQDKDARVRDTSKTGKRVSGQDEAVGEDSEKRRETTQRGR